MTSDLPSEFDAPVEVMAQGDWLRLARIGRWEYVERIHSERAGSTAVIILAVTPDDEVLLVEQPRAAVAGRSLEFPAGLVGDLDDDEPIERAAGRELVEETGWEAGSIETAVVGVTSPGLSSEALTIVVATDLTRVGDGGGDETEDITVHAVPRASVASWIAARIEDGLAPDLKLWTGLWLLEHELDGSPRAAVVGEEPDDVGARNRSSGQVDRTAVRAAVLSRVVEAVQACPGRPTLVGVDGRDGAGKTRFADHLADDLADRGRRVVRVGLDRFVHPREVRHAKGRYSPEGFFADSYDLDGFLREVVEPLQRGGSRIRPGIYDLASETPSLAPLVAVPPDAVVLVDGLFLHRERLVDTWDVSVFLQVDPAEAFARMAARDGGDPDPDAPSNRRYRDGVRMYLEADDPAGIATFTIDNRDWAHPVVMADRQAGMQGGSAPTANPA